MAGRLETEKQQRREALRAKLSRTIRVRPFDLRLSGEICRITNFSRTGLYFETSLEQYHAGMYVSVVRNFQREDPVHREETAKIMRVEKLDHGGWGVAIRIL
jgi:hypothetical protein